MLNFFSTCETLCALYGARTWTELVLYSTRNTHTGTRAHMYRNARTTQATLRTGPGVGSQGIKDPSHYMKGITQLRHNIMRPTISPTQGFTP
jgi:hypothetical protein